MAGHWEAEIRYEAYREGARDISRLRLAGKGLNLSPDDWEKIRFGPIDDDALEIWQGTWPEKAFPWPEVMKVLRADTDRFELSIWKGEELCGLAAGRSSNGPDNVTIHFLEKKRPENSLHGRIALMATDVAERYAFGLKKQRLKIKDPLEDSLVVYKRLGFTVAESLGNTTYWERPIG